MTNAAIVWRSLDDPGHESCRLSMQDGLPQISGTAVFSYEEQPCQLSYTITCDQQWHTTAATVSGWVGQHPIAIEIAVNGGRWWMNGREWPALDSCIDLDLNFSPVTNMLPIQRLNLAIGQDSAVRAAWLRFPSFELEPLDQRYQRVGDTTYRYESTATSFVAMLEINEAGFVTTYGDLWLAEATSSDSAL